MDSRSERLAFLLVLVILVITRLVTLTHLLPGFCVDDERWIQEGSLQMVRNMSLDPGTHKYPGLMFEVTAAAQFLFFVLSQWKAILYLKGPGAFRFFLEHFHFGFSSTILVGRLTVLIIAICCLLVFYRALKSRLDIVTVLFSALLMISAPAFQFSCLLLKTDMLLLLGILLTMAAAIRILERGSMTDYALGALGLGISLAAKYHFLALVPLLLAHRYRHPDLPFLKTLKTPRLPIMLALALVVFFIGSPMSFIDPAGMVKALALEMVLQNRVTPLLKASPVLWWHKPVLYQLLAVLPLALGIPLYMLCLIGLRDLKKMERRLRLVIFSYPAAFLVFMMLSSKLAYPHLYLPLVPFFCLAGGFFLTNRFMNGGRLKSLLCLLVLVFITGYNLALFRGFVTAERTVLLEGMARFKTEVAKNGRGLGLIPYFANPADVPQDAVFLPQFMLSPELLEKEKPQVIFVHHALYQGYADNPELKSDPCYQGYLLLINGEAGYREIMFQHRSMNDRLYGKLLPDLLGMRTGVFIRR